MKMTLAELGPNWHEKFGLPGVQMGGPKLLSAKDNSAAISEYL
jgi:hypothetical protein